MCRQGVDSDGHKECLKKLIKNLKLELKLSSLRELN